MFCVLMSLDRWVLAAHLWVEWPKSLVCTYMTDKKKQAVCGGMGFRVRGLFVIREGLVDQYLVTPNAYNITRTGSSVCPTKEIVCGGSGGSNIGSC
jgi:hypothetical protein